ncbi:Hypothetical protein EIN_484970, partial [Entamoeba invadens IP1]
SWRRFASGRLIQTGKSTSFNPKKFLNLKMRNRSSNRNVEAFENLYPILIIFIGKKIHNIIKSAIENIQL